MLCSWEEIPEVRRVKRFKQVAEDAQFDWFVLYVVPTLRLYF